jgi:D-lactate dehydrogenase (cytochrome)
MWGIRRLHFEILLACFRHLMASHDRLLGFAVGVAATAAAGIWLIQASDYYGRRAASSESSPRPDMAKAVAALSSALPAACISTETGTREKYGSAPGTAHLSTPPAVVVWPMSTEDVVSIVKIARDCRVPVIATSGRTSLEGHTLALPGNSRESICVSLDRMDKILAINARDGDAVVQPGVGWAVLNQKLRDQGVPLFFPIDPSPNALFGGMIGAGGSGTGAVRFVF